MKNAIMKTSSKCFFLFLCLMSGMQAFAQDANSAQSSSTETHTTTSTAAADAPNWMNNPTVWIVGAVVLLLILVIAISSRSSVSKSKVTRTTTTEVKSE